MPRGRRVAQATQPQPPPAAAAETAAQPVTQPIAATRSSRSRIPPDNDGEFFDLENVSGLDDEDQADTPQARARFRNMPAANMSNMQVNDPTPAPKKGTAALDIDYFYDRQKGRDTICNECK
jgi:septal ring-binding cell division protein DamX